MPVSIELFIVVLFSLVLLVSAGMRHVARFSGIPFTILMLVVGLGAGFLISGLETRHGFFSHFNPQSKHSFISPEMILFVFLPMLIFESAFSLDPRTFRKLLPNICILAGPAIIFTSLCTAALMLYITPASWGWTLSYALLFGALINATDPVAVVALLRELGISKRLVTLIEGESLLNDGTAIVLFTVFLSISATGLEHLSLPLMLWQLSKVIIGGVFIGWILAVFVSRWIGRIFNDPLLEITLMMALAYLAMAIAEGFLHVSGVMALVVSGLYMRHVGRTRISPEVFDFLGEFWEMMAYIANALIFFLVGLVIALQTSMVHLQEVWVAVVAYVGIMMIRTLTIFICRPVFAAFKNPISKKQAFIVSWGGLRGAVSLALALLLSQTTTLDEGFRQQALLFTATIVLLSVVFNGATMKVILKCLQLDQPSMASQISASFAQISVLNDVQNMMTELSRSSNFRHVFWTDIKNEIESRKQRIQARSLELMVTVNRDAPQEQTGELWLRALNIERSAYWDLFSQGILSAKAIGTLTNQIDLHVDQIKSGHFPQLDQRTPPLSKSLRTLNMLFRRYPFLQQKFGFIIFDSLMLQFHCYHAEQFAAEHVLDNLSTLEGLSKDVELDIQHTYQAFRQNAKLQTEEMRSSSPRLAQAIESYFARRLTLNKERAGIKQLHQFGLLDDGIAHDVLQEIESRMHALEHFPASLPQPSTEELLAEIPLFELCSETEIAALAGVVSEHLLLKGDYLFEQGERSDSFYIVLRGALQIQQKSADANQVIATLGGGDIVGEMAMLTQMPRMASALALTDVTVIKMTSEDFHRVSEHSPQLLNHTWMAFGRHLLMNHRQQWPYLARLSEAKFNQVIAQTQLKAVPKGAQVNRPKGAILAFIIQGALSCQGEAHRFSALLDVREGQTIQATQDSRLLWIFE